MSSGSVLPSISVLVSLCEEYLSGKRVFAGKPEEMTKQVLIEPLFEHHLSWSKTPNEDYYEREFRGEVKGKEWKDIVLLTEKKPRIFIETKACVDTNIARKYAKELLMYLKGYNADKNESEWVTWGILTSFTETYFYHWSEPVSSPTPFYVLNYKELPSRIGELQALLSPEGVRGNRLLNRYLESPAHKLDEDFLQDLKKWRKIIANGFYKKNRNLSLGEISELSHIFLSRLIFLRRLEATGVLQPHWLKNQYEAWKEGRTLPTPTFSEYLRELVKGFWRLYDTELFEEQACDKCEFEDSYFKDLLKYMAPPIPEVRQLADVQELQDRGLYGYKFGELTLDILGTVYERYLAHRLEFKVVRRVKIVTIEENAELRQKEGAYFTPPHIVKFIVAKTVESRLQKILEEAKELLAKHLFEQAKKKIRDISSLKVVDPAAGSGSFLIEAFKTFVRYYRLYNEAVSREFSGLPYQHNQSSVFQVDKVTERVLLENLFGVDMDPKAVEVMKLNLWLHHIDCNQSDYQYTGGAAKKKLLPQLDLNIQVGNSTIDGDTSRLSLHKEQLKRIGVLRKKLAEVRIALSRNKDDLEVESLQKQDKAAKVELDALVDEVEREINTRLYAYRDSTDFKSWFNWQVRFPEVFAQGGFDGYIGNPPYINLYRFTGKYREYLSARDHEVFRAKNDILYHFYKRGIELLKEGGSLGYITSRYFLEAENADLLRVFLASSTSIEILIDYGNVELFKGINTRCIVTILRKHAGGTPDNRVEIGKVRRWRESHDQLTQLIDANLGKEFSTPDKTVSVFGMEQAAFGREPWRLLSPQERVFLEKIEENSWRLGDTEDEEGLCELGMGMQTGCDEAFRVTSRQIEEENLERPFIRKLVRNGDIRKYFTHHEDSYIIYTEGIENIGEFPNIKAHLMKYRDRLLKRYPCKGPKPKRKWFQYTVPNMQWAFQRPEKIVVPYRAPGNRFALNTEKCIGAFDIYVVVPKEKSPVSTRYLLAILNSSLMDYAYITFYGRRKKAEFEYFSELMNRLPIRKPNHTIRRKLEELAGKLTELHSERLQLLRLYKRLIEATSGKSETTLKHYYDNALAYGIHEKERLLEDVHPKEIHKGQPVDSCALHKIGAEERDNVLLIEAEFQVGSESIRREKVLKITIENEDLRRFLLYSLRLFVENSRNREVIGREADLLDAVLRNVKLDRLSTNINENMRAIHALMEEFKAEAPVVSSISEIEREIWERSKEIDEVVYSLYELDTASEDVLREMYHCNTVSEFIDRLEEYVGVQDIQPE